MPLPVLLFLWELSVLVGRWERPPRYLAVSPVLWQLIQRVMQVAVTLLTLSRAGQHALVVDAVARSDMVESRAGDRRVTHRPVQTADGTTEKAASPVNYVTCGGSHRQPIRNR